jgi:zinc D-Ala-D-Ala dipeptidase
MKSKYLLIVICFLFSCKNTKTEEKSIHKTPVVIEQKTMSSIENSMLQQGLVLVKDIDKSIRVEMKYSTTDNFMKADVYGDFDAAYLQPKAAKMLKEANRFLKEANPDYTLLIYDAARPRSIQQVLWDTLKVKPGEIKTDFVADPKKGSIHNYGCAVDLTVYDLTTQKPLDMGTKYDFFGEMAYPKHEKRLLNEGKLTEEQINNRKILRIAMQKAGYMPIESEWWHFNSISREKAKSDYKIVE